MIHVSAWVMITIQLRVKKEDFNVRAISLYRSRVRVFLSVILSYTYAPFDLQ